MFSTHDFLADFLKPDRLTHVVDVGANPIEGDPPYKKMLQSNLCRVTGFEPQLSALHELNAKKSENETYLPYALGSGGDKVLNVCRYSGWTSLLKPRKATLDIFSQFKNNAQVIQTLDVKTHRLDDLPEVTAFDLLKIDVQGGELDVFMGGINHLKNAVAIQTEVSFITLYEKQPCFGTIDLTLRKLGFVPHCFNQVKTWPVGPLQFEGNSPQQFNQLLEADVVYVKDFIDPVLMSNEQLKHLCLLMFHCYGSLDLSGRCIELLESRGVLPDGVKKYVEFLNSQH